MGEQGMSLEGKVAIVTGGNSGIGRAIVLELLDVNLKSAFFGAQIAARQMIKQGGGGRIINITSVHEDWPMPGNTAYCLSKGGMRMLTRTAGVELAPHNIRVVGVGPGAVATPINLVTMKDSALMQKLDNAIPLG